MSWLNLWAIAFGLAMDAFAVSIAAGLTVRTVTPRHVFRIGWHFGLFQFLMPIVGWFLGSRVSYLIEAYDHWIAFALLAFVGGKMLHEAVSHAEERSRPEPTRGWMLITLSVATSIDALAIGLSLACLQISIWGPAVIIGLVAGTLSAAGITFAARFFRRWQRAAEIAGGVVLILIGLKILMEHLTAR